MQGGMAEECGVYMGWLMVQMRMRMKQEARRARRETEKETGKECVVNLSESSLLRSRLASRARLSCTTNHLGETTGDIAQLHGRLALPACTAFVKDHTGHEPGASISCTEGQALVLIHDWGWRRRSSRKGASWSHNGSILHGHVSVL